MSYVGRGARWLAVELAADAARPVTDPAADMLKTGYRLGRGARYVQHGASGLAAPRPGATSVAGELWHGGSDRENALRQLGLDYATLRRELQEAGTDDLEIAAWTARHAAPVFEAWGRFIAHLARSKLAPYVTEWSVYESWRARLVHLRDQASARGIELASSPPLPLPQTIWQRGESGQGSSLDSWITLGKSVVLGAMALTGVAAFYTILRDVRHGRIRE